MNPVIYNDLSLLPCYGSAHLQFGMHRLTPALNKFIKKQYPEQKHMNFLKCCNHILNNLDQFFRNEDIAKKKKLFSRALQIAEEVLNQRSSLQFFVQHVDCLCLLALTIGRKDLSKKIRAFQCGGISLYREPPELISGTPL
jgi:hypothetical protein